MSNVKSGFSIIEVIIAVFVIVVGLVAMMNLMANSLRHTIDSRDLIIASSLAQEGVELVKNVRDNSWLDATPTDPFDDFKNSADMDKCIVDMNSSDVTTCSGSVDYKLYYKSGFFVHDSVSSTPTKFQRKINLTYYDSTGAIIQNTSNAVKTKVLAIVTWNQTAFPANCNTANKCVYAEDILTNWH